MRTWVLLFGLASLAGLSEAGIWAFGVLAEPYRAEAFACSEANARGISWPIAESSKSGKHEIWHFNFANPDCKTETLQITVRRDQAGKWLAIIPEKDQEKWPRLNADSR